MSELISVIIPSYDRFESLIKAIKSVQKQTIYDRVKVIYVVNDKSIEREYYRSDIFKNDGKIKFITNSENTSRKFGFPCPAYSRNKVLEIIDTDYIAFLDDDDLWYPQKLEYQIAVLNKTKLFGCCTAFSQDEGLVQYTKEELIDLPSHIVKQADIYLHNELKLSSLLIRKNIQTRFKMLPINFDTYDYFYNLLDVNDIVFIDKPFIAYTNNTEHHVNLRKTKKYLILNKEITSLIIENFRDFIIDYVNLFIKNSQKLKPNFLISSRNYNNIKKYQDFDIEESIFTNIINIISLYYKSTNIIITGFDGGIFALLMLLLGKNVILLSQPNDVNQFEQEIIGYLEKTYPRQFKKYVFYFDNTIISAFDTNLNYDMFIYHNFKVVADIVRAIKPNILVSPHTIDFHSYNELTDLYPIYQTKYKYYIKK